MNSDSLLFPWIATCVAVGIALAQYVVAPLGATLFLISLALLLIIAFSQIRREWLAALTLSSFFFIVGFLRAQLGDLSLLPQSLIELSKSLSCHLQDFIRDTNMNSDTTSLLEAMMLGIRDNLTAETRELYRSAGVSHVLALSGLHLGILFGLFNFWLQHVLVSRWRYLIGCMGIIMIWCYALLTAFPTSLCRASLMMTLLVIGQMRLVGNNAWHTLGLAAFLILMIVPTSLFDIGFQLSFTAVAGILLFYGPLCAIWQPKSSVMRWCWSLALVGIAAQLGVFPLLLYWFHTFNIVSIFIGPFVVVMATSILYATLLMLPLHLIGVGGLLCKLIEMFVAIQHGLLTFVSHISWGRVENVSLLPGSLLLLYMALLCLLPTLHALRKPVNQPRIYRVAMFFRTWPYLLAVLILLLAVIFL